MDIKQYMGSKIKEYRKAMKLTTQELGDLSDTSQSTISQIERGNEGSFTKDLLVLRCSIQAILKRAESTRSGTLIIL